ncbi:MAG: PQQ-binding-like beta-propeller repeat protein [Thermoguttaceae bacterium]
MLRHFLRPLWIAVASIAVTALAEVEQWPGWRGPRGDGTSREKNVPTSWDGASGRNIAWRAAVPGRGHASPIVWGDRVIVSTCLEEQEQRVLICFDRRTGELLWRRTVVEAPLEKLHRLNSYASGTPATDGRLVYAAYLEPDSSSPTEASPGNIVVAAYDLDGRQAWLVRPGRFSSIHGFCTSPILYENLLIVNGDHDGDSFIYGLDKRTGETVWKTPREHKTRSYCAPIIREIDGRTQMVFSGSKCVVSLDPRDGSQHWLIDGPTEQFVASLVYNGRYFFLTAGFPEHHTLAIRPDGRGNVTDTHIVWRTTRGCAYVPSPIVEGDYFLVASDNGIVSCFEADTGHRHWMQRTAPHYSASSVSAEGLVHLTDDRGTTKIVRPGPEWELVAENELGENCYSSAAISQGRIFLRGERHLYCIGAGPSEP